MEALEARLSNVAQCPPKRRRNRRNKRGSAVVAPPVQQAQIRAVASTSGGRRRRRARGSGVAASLDGSMTIMREEFVAAIKVSDTAGVIKLIPQSFSWLKNIAKAYERLTWLSAKVYYKPAVGTNQDGLVVYGVDWNSKPPSEDPTREQVQALTPVADHPVWQDSRPQPMVLPSSKLQTRKEYLIATGDDCDQMPGVLLYNCSVQKNPANTKLLGELWICYKIHFFGTTT